MFDSQVTPTQHDTTYQVSGKLASEVCEWGEGGGRILKQDIDAARRTTDIDQSMLR